MVPAILARWRFAVAGVMKVRYYADSFKGVVIRFWLWF